MIFEAIRDKETRHIVKIDRYWIILHKPTVDKRLLNGITHSRLDLNIIERNIFQIKSKRNEEKNIEITFPIVTSDPLILQDDINHTYAQCIAFGHIIVSFISIDLKPTNSFIPKVLGVIVKGVDLYSGNAADKFIKAPSFKQQLKAKRAL
jgi:hypothetical protein